MRQASAGNRPSIEHQKTDQQMGNAVTTPFEAVPLWYQLNATAAVLMAVRTGRSWTTAQLDIDPAIRPGVQALSFAVLRNYGTALALRALLAPRTPSAIADVLLCSVLALALESTEQMATTDHDGAGVSYAAHTLVSQAVEAAKRNPNTKAQANFINACLRRFLRERETLLALAKRQPQAQWNHPPWWIEQIKQDYPEQWQALLQANAFAAPMTLRVNTIQSSRDDYKLALDALNIEATEVADSGLELSRSVYVPGLPGFSQGWFSVQDEAAQLAAPMLLKALLEHISIKGTLRILDACAAPGGKTAHLLEYAAAHGLNIEVLALDVDALRCQRIHENLQRLQLTAQVVAADAAHGGTVYLLMQYYWTHPAQPRALFGGIQTYAGYVAKPTLHRWFRSKRCC
jgi:16S rRNA (cytosine967-C5)-methyltransferase